MKIALICFTSNGAKIAKKIVQTGTTEEEAAVYRKSSFVSDSDMIIVNQSLSDWCRSLWAEVDGFIFISSTGIAVRAISGLPVDKFYDPFILVIDDTGRFCISLLSGHTGGANQFAGEIADRIGAIPVITTSTDRNQVFSIDVFAKAEGLQIPNRMVAKEISARLLHKMPVVTIGIGCKKGVSSETIEYRIREDLKRLKVPFESIKELASIDRKKSEKGLQMFCSQYQIPFCTYTAEELLQVKGVFTGSRFVESVVSVDNVCERSAVLASKNGILIQKKTTGSGVTVAVAIGLEMDK